MSDLIHTTNDSSNHQNGQNRFQFIPNQTMESDPPTGGMFDPKETVLILLRYKWLVIFFLVAGTAGAWVYSKNVTPIFESRGTLLITSLNTSSDSELSRIISQATGFGTSSTLENELQILGSREFSRQVAQKLIEEDPGDINLYPVLWEETESGEIYRVPEASVAARIREDLGFRQPEEESDVVEIRFRSPSATEAAKIVNEAMEIYVENSTRQNRQAARSTAEFLLNEKQDIELNLEASEERLRSFMGATGIVQVNEQATGVINQRAATEAELMRVNIELQTIGQAISNLEGELEELRPGLIDQISAAIGPRIRRSQDDLARYESERTLIISKNPGVLELGTLPDRLLFLDYQIERLTEEIKTLSNQLFTEDSEFLGMDSEERATIVVEIQRRLVDLRIEQNQYQSRSNALLQHKAEMDASFNLLPEGMIELAKLQRDVTMNEELYLNVSRRYADMSVWTQSQFGFGRIIDPADVTDVPVHPNSKIFILLGVMFSGLLATGFIFIRESLDNSLKNADELRDAYLQTGTLSIIPVFEKVSRKNRKSFITGKGQIPFELVLLQDRTSFPAESIRRLKNNIIYQHGYKPPKTITVTSPEKKDGKSTVAANLGIAFAEAGFNTLLIDADFRRPKLDKYFGLTDKNGLTNYFSGEIPYEQLIHSTDLISLKVIPAGSEAQRPDTIISSDVFKRFRERMEEIYDVVIFDTAPFGIISDSAALLKDTEALIVVVSHRKTNRGMFLRTIEELQHIQANITGIVLNNFDHRKETGQYYGPGYYKALYSSYEEYVK